ncbi:hypothetical protein [Moritella sp. Urea-trap-13]|uniref:hypothetical protein n=1 Tax=Moritella sp. Urea-trap-13 TaxID=2058327 RepID=UPI000C33292D|nr:hypothetical protein [Moritella sp. Urea-trap-13]PKH04779.1 hypothetical protein CXF93_21435 [Moritella sp. Urea-trap-13]
MLKKTLVLSSILLSSAMVNSADIADSKSQVNFEGALLQGAGNQITMLRVPITNKETGVTHLFDMSAVFAPDPNGDLGFENVSSVKSVVFGSANQLIAGQYKDSNQYTWYVDGPSVAADGRLSWVLSQTRNSHDVHLLSGPLKGNELAVNSKGYSTLIKNASGLNYGILNGDYIMSGAQSGKMISLTSYNSDGTPRNTWALRPDPKKPK